jgi:hypothetical protein
MTSPPQNAALQHLTIADLQTENARLIALLEAHDIDWRLPPQPVVIEPRASTAPQLSTTEKVALFRRLFRGRTDVFPVRWESKTSGKSGYTPILPLISGMSARQASPIQVNFVGSLRQAQRQDRHRPHAVPVAAGRGEPSGRRLWAVDCG